MEVFFTNEWFAAFVERVVPAGLRVTFEVDGSSTVIPEADLSERVVVSEAASDRPAAAAAKVKASPPQLPQTPTKTRRKVLRPVRRIDSAEKRKQSIQEEGGGLLSKRKNRTTPFDRCVERIAAEHHRRSSDLGCGGGWRFLLGPRESLDECGPGRLAVVALNPGGAAPIPPIVEVRENAYMAAQPMRGPEGAKRCRLPTDLVVEAKRW